MRMEILQGSVFDELPKLDSESVDLCITSPPYWGLRDYGVVGQLGLEPTMKEYLDNTLRWVKEVWRVLKPTGSFVLNLGDCYIGGGRGKEGNQLDQNLKGDRSLQPNNSILARDKIGKSLTSRFYKEKQLLSVSSFAYCKIVSETDFVCRNEIIWCKPNVPSPIRSRLKHSHEKLFWFVKDADKYCFDAKSWMKKVTEVSHNRGKYPVNMAHFNSGAQDKSKQEVHYPIETIESSFLNIPCGEKQKGFELSEKGVQEHIAPFPSKLIKPFIQSLCPREGVVLDPFLGSGTTMRVALENKRSCIGIELNPKYVEYTKKRVNWGQGFEIEWAGRK